MFFLYFFFSLRDTTPCITITSTWVCPKERETINQLKWGIGAISGYWAQQNQNFETSKTKAIQEKAPKGLKHEGSQETMSNTYSKVGLLIFKKLFSWLYKYHVHLIYIKYIIPHMLNNFHLFLFRQEALFSVQIFAYLW